jgi:hypothetical protein
MIPKRFIGENILHLPTVKTHVFTTTTGAMKNAFGGLLNEKRHWTHPVIHETLVDLLMIQKKIHRGVFAVMDGTFAGDGPGPRCMLPHVKNVMLAGADQVAIDAVAAKLMGFDPMSIKFIRMAHELGLGCGDPRDIEVVGDLDAAKENWNFIGPFKKMTFASQMQHYIYWGPLKKPIEWSLKTVLAPWAYMASVIYHDSIWYPLNARSRSNRCSTARGDGCSKTGSTSHQTLTVFRASVKRRARLRAPACTLSNNHWAFSAPASRKRRVCQPPAAHQAARGPRDERVHHPVRVGRRRADHENRSASESSRSAAPTTPRIRFASWRRCGSRSSSTRTTCGRICSNSSQEPAVAGQRTAGDHAAVHADEADIFATHRGALRFMRKLFNPLLKMMFNPNTLLHVLHTQAQFNVDLLKREARRKIEFDRRAPNGTRSTTRSCTTWCSKPRAWASRSRTCA